MSVSETSDKGLEGLTHAAASFAATLSFEALPEAAVRLAKRCVIDGLGVALAGARQPGMEPLRQHIRRTGGAADARLLAGGGEAFPVAQAALWAARPATRWTGTTPSWPRGPAGPTAC
jgi:2-methylcitrate dehydratase PrpD